MEFILDTPEALSVGAGEYILKGWCFSRASGDILKVSVLFDGSEVEAFLGFPRPDVAAAFENEATLRCGFIARFPRPKNQPAVALIVRRNGIEFTRIDNISLGVALMDWESEPLEREPLISICLTTDNTPPYYLKRCVESVLQQNYERWQLCITDDQSSENAVIQILDEYVGADSRIHLDQSAEPAGHAAACNACLKNAQGEFIALLKDCDELHPYALRELARSIDEFPEVWLFYSDEDEIDDVGAPGRRLCKPEFDPQSLLSLNYLGNLMAIKRDMAVKLGGWRLRCEGAHDWDLLIRASESVAPAAIKRIPKALYRSRVKESNPNLSRIRTRVLEDHLERTGKFARVVEGLLPGSMRLQYPAPREVEVAVFLRPQDGVFQQSVVKMNSGRRVVNLYQPDEPATEDVFVFINGPLESLNHLFFEELVAQSCRPDGGFVTGISRNRGDIGGMEVVRRVGIFPLTFFAVRRDRLSEPGGMAMLFTPYAVATFSPGGKTPFRCEVTQEALAKENDRSTVPIALVEKSHSWRITKRLRALMRALRSGVSS